jgi:glycosyltransferase involved in cell wall biosynthesis
MGSTADVPLERPRAALVHDYFTQRGGAERVATRLAGLFGNARLFTAVVDPDVMPEALARTRVSTSALQRLRQAGVPLQAFAPVLPAAFGAFDVGDVDVVVSSSSAFAHHVRPPAGATHVCYCHTPPRFLWEGDEYFGSRRLVGRLGAGPLAVLRRWDAAAARRVDTYVANSIFTADRIRRTYGRDPVIVYPPVETDDLRPSTERSGRFLVVARLRPHKRVDLAIGAANALRVPLDIIGEGSDLPRLRALAGPSIRFLGRRSDAEVGRAMARCTALLTPGIEDFGMVTAEVQAAGRPPVAYAAGGSTEIVRDGATGFLFAEQSIEAVAEAMRRAMREALDPARLVASAARFDARRFDATILGLANAAAAGAPAVAGAVRLPATWPVIGHGETQTRPPLRDPVP